MAATYYCGIIPETESVLVSRKLSAACVSFMYKRPLVIYRQIASSLPIPNTKPILTPWRIRLKVLFAACVAMVVFVCVKWQASDDCDEPTFNAAGTNCLPTALPRPTQKKGVITLAWVESGLGNSMFQYAAILGFAKKYDLAPVLQNAPEHVAGQYAPFPNILAPLINPNDTGDWTTIYERCCCCYDEESFRNLSSNETAYYVVGGYFQSWKYFAEIRDIVLHKFSFRQDIAASAEQLLSKLRSTHCPQNQLCLIVGVHNRRGDYVNPKVAEVGYLVADVDYFERAMTYLTNRRAGFHLVFAIVSNDNEWSNQNLGPSAALGKTFHTVVQPDRSREIDMCFLSMTDHVILTAGTFGWWAGYLSNGDVIYRAELARNGSLLASGIAAKDFIPPNWIGL